MIKIHKFVFSPIEVNTYLLEGEEGECAIIDCGCYDEGEFSRLVEFIEKNELKPVLLLNTHCHLDHIFGNRFVLEKWGLKPRYSQLDEPNRRLAPQHAAIYGLKMEIQPAAEQHIEEGDVIELGQNKFTAILVPGHTTGTLNFYNKEQGILFSGDALFAGSIGRTDLPGGDHATLLKNIKQKLFSLPAETIVYPGHGPSTTIGDELTSNPFLS